jgi:hypothetical protein
MSKAIDIGHKVVSRAATAAALTATSGSPPHPGSSRSGR